MTQSGHRADRNPAAQQSPDVLRCAILFVGSTEVSGSETARVDLAAYRRHGFGSDVERQLTDGRRPMQFMLIVVTIAAAILFDVRPSGAYQGPWCAVENIGQDVRYDCSMRTLEQCVSLIIAGNRGFCNPNPYYRGPEAAPPRVKRKR